MVSEVIASLLQPSIAGRRVQAQIPLLSQSTDQTISYIQSVVQLQGETLSFTPNFYCICTVLTPRVGGDIKRYKLVHGPRLIIDAASIDKINQKTTSSTKIPQFLVLPLRVRTTPITTTPTIRLKNKVIYKQLIPSRVGIQVDAEHSQRNPCAHRMFLNAISSKLADPAIC